ncbi:MAG: hypothetical protein LBG96_05920 [Tannerella sp.]|jgi:hypothetical protein|nr:hypothetical protein [Tannerella sp.]
MRIFKVNNDANNVQALLPTNKTFYNHYFKCESLMEKWNFYEMYNSTPAKKSKDFYTMFTSGVLIFNESTLEICRTVFEMAGEILPVKVERGPDLYLLNVLECMNGLNYDTTVWDYYNDGTKGRILKFGFHPERVLNEASIFKIPEVISTIIFCYADVKNPDDEFYHIYHKHKLTGLIFEEVYSD